MLSTKASGRTISAMVEEKLLILMAKSTRVILKITRKKVSERKLSSMSYPNNKMYKGGFKNNKPHGKGTLYQPDGTIVNGVWDMGIIITNS